jgi:hypothetical protein
MVNPDELGTIFPTKTPEYLAAGRPILVHCPENYFLARFFQKHECGLVVSERSVDALVRGCQRLLEHREGTDELATRAQKAARLFRPERITVRFKDAVERAAQKGDQPKPLLRLARAGSTFPSFRKIRVFNVSLQHG